MSSKKPSLPAATKLGQGNKFTRVCLSTRGGGCLLQIFGGGCLLQIFGGCLLQIFGGVPAPNFRGGACSKFSGGCLLQIFGGGACSKFLGGVPAPNFRGGFEIFFSFFQFIYPPKKILLACTTPPTSEMVNARPVRILLECILV